MNKNTKLTEEYKAEISDILKEISSGLGESVISKIDPKIDYIHSIVKEIKNENSESQEYLMKTIESFGNDIENFKKEYNSEIEKSLNKIDSEITILKKNTESTIQENHDILIKQVSKDLSQITDLLNNQNEIEVILNKIDTANSGQTTLLEKLTYKSDTTNEELITNQEYINNALSDNNKLLKNTNKAIEINIIKQLSNISFIVDKIQSDNVLEIKLKETQLKQDRTSKLIYLLIGIVIAVLITTISILIK
ncbi:hypothetical protein [Lentimicrobium sp. S6]|uniref:hypothetical protein n=1 Tax=Lentimicrobium sp. S6 TaxID=2735872 RepID=UPI001552AF03|nr:hypothetical protein [Lentimicrobium sp. S6]NPD46906.1 hypothetical protein [Lentimicrobium sp. S6]